MSNKLTKPIIYKIFPKANKIVVQEVINRIKETRRPQTKQDVVNSMIEEYPLLIEKIKELQTNK